MLLKKYKNRDGGGSGSLARPASEFGDPKRGEREAHTGNTHSDESPRRALMSEAKTGANNPMYGCTGALNPMYGKSGELSPVSIQVNVYSLDGTLINSFSSQVAAAEWLSVNQSTISRYLKSGKVWNNKYLFRNSS